MSRCNKKRARWVLRRQTDRHLRKLEALYDKSSSVWKTWRTSWWRKMKDAPLVPTTFQLTKQEWDGIRGAYSDALLAEFVAVDGTYFEDQHEEKTGIAKENEAPQVAEPTRTDA